MSAGIFIQVSCRPRIELLPKGVQVEVCKGAAYFEMTWLPNDDQDFSKGPITHAQEYH